MSKLAFLPYADPLLFDEVLCTRTPAEIAGIAAATTSKANEHAAKAAPRSDSPRGSAGIAPEQRAKAASKFRSIRAKALVIAASKVSKHSRADAEAYLAQAIGNYFGKELKVLGLSAPLEGVDVLPFVNTLIRAYLIPNLSASAGSREPQFIIVGGELDGVSIQLEEIITLKPEYFDGVIMEDQ